MEGKADSYKEPRQKRLKKSDSEEKIQQEEAEVAE